MTAYYRNLIITITLFTIYASARYIYFQGVSIEHFPLFIMNKVLAWTSATYFALSFIAKYFKAFDKGITQNTSKKLGLTALLLSFSHIIISLILLSPEYYGKFYSGNMLNIYGEISMLAGVAAFTFLLLLGLASIPGIVTDLKNLSSIFRLRYWTYFLLAIHLIFMGIPGWYEPLSWPQGLVPISLLAFLFLLFAIIFKTISERILKNKKLKI